MALKWNQSPEETPQQSNVWFAATVGLLGIIAGYVLGTLL